MAFSMPMNLSIEILFRRQPPIGHVRNCSIIKLKTKEKHKQPDTVDLKSSQLSEYMFVFFNPNSDEGFLHIPKLLCSWENVHVIFCLLMQ